MRALAAMVGVGSLYGVDGTTLRVPDSTDNARYFGYSHSVRGESAYPMVRGVGLMALRSHLLAAVAFGPYAAGEISYATNLWSSLPREPALARAPAARTPRRARRARGLARSSQAGPEPARALGRASGHLPAEGLPPADPAHFADRSGRVPADEIAMLYHERWELELGYDEIKTELLDREEAIRSRTRPESSRSCGGSSSPTTSCASRWSESLAMRASNRRGSASSRRSDSSATNGCGAPLPRRAPSRSTCGTSVPRSRR